jgi:hypothetical protein
LFKYFDFDPNIDIKVQNGVWEWNSLKREMHNFVKEIFFVKKRRFINSWSRS